MKRLWKIIRAVYRHFRFLFSPHLSDFRFHNSYFIIHNSDFILHTSSFILLFLLFSTAANGATVPADVIRAEVDRTVREYAARKGLDFEITVPHVRDVEIASAVTPVVRASLAGREIRGVSAPVRVDFLDGNGSVIRGIHLVAQVRMYAMVAVAARDIQRGDTLRVEDVRLKRADVSTVRKYYIKSGDTVGTLACQSMKAGTILRPGMVKREPLVHRGDRVTMKAAVGNVSLTAEGIAREDGGRGEYIRVFNSQTKVSVICTVIDAQTVTVGRTGG